MSNIQIPSLRHYIESPKT